MTHQPEAGSTTAKAPKKKRRIFLWVFLAVQVVFIVWIVAGVTQAGGSPDDCEGLSREACNNAESIGTGIGVALIVGVWLVVDFLLAVIYGVYRLAKRT